MSDAARRQFTIQLAGVMDALLKTAVCEIARIFEGSLSEQQTELNQKMEELSALRGRLERAEKSLGTGGQALLSEDDPGSTSQTLASLMKDEYDAPDDWCAPILDDDDDDPAPKPSTVPEEEDEIVDVEEVEEVPTECPSVTLKPLSVALWRIPNVKREVQEDFESHLFTALSTSPADRRSGGVDSLQDRFKRTLKCVNTALTVSGGHDYTQEDKKSPVKEQKEGAISPARKRSGKPKNIEQGSLVCCKYCPRSFDTSRGLKVHMDSHKRCSLCYRTFQYPSFLQQHMLSCGRLHKRKGAIDQTLNHNVSPPKRHPCDRCDRKFRTTERLSRHMEKEHGVDPGKSDQIKGEVDWIIPVNALTDQKPPITTGSSPKSQKPLASSQEKGQASLIRVGLLNPNAPVVKRKVGRPPKDPHHPKTIEVKIKEVKIKDEKMKDEKSYPFKCKQCPRAFLTSTALKMHISKAFHKRCTICKKKFGLKSDLKLHMLKCKKGKLKKGLTKEKNNHQKGKMKKDVTENNHQKVKIKKEAAEKSNNHKDLDWTVPVEEPPTSNTSSKAQKGPGKPGKANLIPKRDPKKGEFKCKVCKKILTRKITLIAHLRTHTGEKPCICKLCGKAFRSQPQLSAHRKDCTGRVERLKLQCTDCTRIFPNHEKLTKHRREAHNAKLNTCQICGKGFTYIARLSQHYEREHA